MEAATSSRNGSRAVHVDSRSTSPALRVTLVLLFILILLVSTSVIPRAPPTPPGFAPLASTARPPISPVVSVGTHVNRAITSRSSSAPGAQSLSLVGRSYTVNFTIAPARCGPLLINHQDQANDSGVNLPGGTYPMTAPACPGMEPTPGILVTGSLFVYSNLTYLVISGNGTMLLTYYTPLQTSIVGPSSGSVDGVLAFRVLITGGDLSYTEVWSFGDGSSLVNASGSTSATHIFNGPGTFRVQVWVNDTEPTRSVATQMVTISGSVSGGGTPPMTDLYIGVGGVIAAGVVIVLFLAVRQKSSRPRTSESREGSAPARGESPAQSPADSDRVSSPSDQGDGR